MTGFLAYGFFWSGKGPEFAIVFLAVFYRLVPRIQALQDAFYNASIHAAWLSELNDRYDALAANQETDAGKELIGNFITFAFDHVSYSYDKEHEVIKDIAFTLKKGEIVLLAGESGSGKSTLIDLSLGLIQPTQGEILLDNHKLADFSLASWRSKVGLVLQGSPIFFRLYVIDNIALMDPAPRSRKGDALRADGGLLGLHPAAAAGV